MPSPLAGSLARTIGKAFSPTFLSATLTRGTTSYTCRAIFQEYGTGQGAEGVLTGNDCTILILATTLSVEPITGDVVAITGARYAQGVSFVVLSMQPGKAAVTGDPAGATWTLRCRTVPVQGDVQTAYANLAIALGARHTLYRKLGSDPIAPNNVLGAMPVVFADGGGSGFNFNRSLQFDDVLQNALLDVTGLQVGDYLVGARTYFIASIEPMRPVNTVLCNRTISQLRGNSQVDADGGVDKGLPSQPGSQGTYWGVNRETPASAAAPGEATIVKNVPCAMVGTAGRATGTGEDPTGPPGPARWRFYLPVSAFPKGSLKDGDLLVDEEGYRHNVSAAVWTPLGYRPEAIREEVQG